MNESTLEWNDLQRRLTALEQGNRRWRAVALGAVALGICLPWSLGFTMPTAGNQAAPQDAAVAESASGDEEVRARRIVIVDADGVERIVLDGGEARGKAEFVMRDSEKRDRIEMGADARTAHVLLRDLEDRNRLGLAVDAHAHLMLNDMHQRPRLHAAVGVTGAPSLLFFNEEGIFPAGMGVQKDGTPWFLPGNPPPEPAPPADPADNAPSETDKDGAPTEEASPAEATRVGPLRPDRRRG